MSIERTTFVLLALLITAMPGCRKDSPGEGAAPAAGTPPPVKVPAPAEAPAAAPTERVGADSAASADPGPADEPKAQEPAAPAPAASGEADTPPPVGAGPEEAADDDVPEPSPVRTRAQVTSPASAVPLPDLRLLLTTNDIDAIAGGKTPLRRTVLAGVPPSTHGDSMMYEPTRGTAYGIGIQLFREGNAALARDRFNAMLASYSSAQEIAPVSGRTFFAYWGDVQYVGFIEPTKNLVIVLSCGRAYCKESDDLYELARKVSARASK